MLANELKIGDYIRLEDMSRAYQGKIVDISQYENYDNGLVVRLDTITLYFVKDTDMKLYELELLRLPCPFCGANSQKRLAVPGSQGNPDEPEQIRFCVFCLDCNVEGPMADNYDEAVRLWNRRK